MANSVDPVLGLHCLFPMPSFYSNFYGTADELRLEEGIGGPAGPDPPKEAA